MLLVWKVARIFLPLAYSQGVGAHWGAVVPFQRRGKTLPAIRLLLLGKRALNLLHPFPPDGSTPPSDRPRPIPLIALASSCHTLPCPHIPLGTLKYPHKPSHDLSSPSLRPPMPSQTRSGSRSCSLLQTGLWLGRFWPSLSHSSFTLCST
jgi:hypothetical protein